MVAFQVRGAVPLQSIPATRGLRPKSAQELVRNGPRGPRAHPVTQGEAESLGAHDISKRAVGAAPGWT